MTDHFTSVILKAVVENYTNTVNRIWLVSLKVLKLIINWSFERSNNLKKRKYLKNIFHLKDN